MNRKLSKREKKKKKNLGGLYIFGHKSEELENMSCVQMQNVAPASTFCGDYIRTALARSSDATFAQSLLSIYPRTQFNMPCHSLHFPGHSLIFFFCYSKVFAMLCLTIDNEEPECLVTLRQRCLWIAVLQTYVEIKRQVPFAPGTTRTSDFWVCWGTCKGGGRLQDSQKLVKVTL